MREVRNYEKNMKKLILVMIIVMKERDQRKLTNISPSGAVCRRIAYVYVSSVDPHCIIYHYT